MEQEDVLASMSKGFGWLDLFREDIEVVFGEWNQRPLDQKHVKDLLNDFISDGCRRFHNSMSIVLQASNWDRTGRLDENPKTRNCAPLRLNNVGGKVKILFAGGRHRYQALRKYLDTIKGYQAHLKGVLAEVAADSDSERDDPERRNTAIHLTYLNGEISLNGKWLVEVFIQGA